MKIEKPITKDIVSEASELANKAGALEDIITNRIHYIMESIFNTFKANAAYWYFYGAGEGEQGDFWRQYSDEEICVVVDRCSDELIILLNDKTEWSLCSSIPTRWLFEDFEEELKNGKIAFEEKILQKKKDQKTKAATLKANKAKLVAEAKKKLSKEELKAIGLK